MRFLGRDPKAPAELTRALELPRGEKVLAFAVDDFTGHTLAATTAELVVLDTQQAVLERHPWSEVDTGQWDPDTWTLSITWVGRRRGSQFTFKEVETRIPEVFHERVQASVVLAASLPTTGAGQSGRVVIRKDLRTGEIFEQVVLGRRTSMSDPTVAQAVARVSANLRDQVGLPPAPPPS